MLDNAIFDYNVINNSICIKSLRYVIFKHFVCKQSVQEIIKLWVSNDIMKETLLANDKAGSYHSCDLVRAKVVVCR